MTTFWFGFGRRWRSPAVERSLFGPVIRLGWLSFGASPYDPPEWVKEWHSRLEAAISKQRRQSGVKGQRS
jgi:hypothetical protein